MRCLQPKSRHENCRDPIEALEVVCCCCFHQEDLSEHCWLVGWLCLTEEVSGIIYIFYSPCSLHCDLNKIKAFSFYQPVTTLS